MNALPETRSTVTAGFMLVMTIGFLIRLYACWATVIIPPDGALYLYQAKMVVHGHWDKITGCGLSYLSNLPLFIAAAYTVLPDWVIAAQAVSLVFGTATLVFIYLILREFCDSAVSSVATLIPAMTPVLVSRSADVVREPVFWFFLSMGLYLFIGHVRRKRFTLYLIGSQLAFLMAAWARIEGILVVPVSLVVLACIHGNHRYRRLGAFLLPLVLLMTSFAVLYVSTGKDISIHFRGREVLTKATSVFQHYGTLRDQMKNVLDPDTPEPLKWYLPEARSNIWLVAAGVLVNRIGEGFFYPYLIVYLIGGMTARKRLKADDRLIYPALLILATLILFYFYILETWMLHYRMVIFALIPGTVFAAFGVEAIRDRLGRTFRLAPGTVLIGLAALIIAASLPKNLALRDPDKIVFRDIARQVASIETDPRGATISTSAPLYRWVCFYANMDVADPPCPQPNPHNSWSRHDGNLKRLIRRLEKSGAGYFLWDEKNWPKKTFAVDGPTVQRHLELLGQWTHPDTGKLMLFKVKADRP